jgi:hypothetical protein
MEALLILYGGIAVVILVLIAALRGILGIRAGLAHLDQLNKELRAFRQDFLDRVPAPPKVPEVHGYTLLPEDLEDDTADTAEPVAPEPAEENPEEEQEDQDGAVSDEELSHIIRDKKKD